MSENILKICIVGAESTGKTTLAQALAEHYQTVWVPEYGRIYSEGKLYLPTYSTWESHEFADIASAQTALARQLLPRANKYIFLDTDAFATSSWHKRYMQTASPEVENIAAKNMADLYLLLDPSVEFVQDGTRDGEHVRQWMHEQFETALREKNQTYKVITGPYSGRAQQAITYIDSYRL